MTTSVNFIEFAAGQIRTEFPVRYRKMFGDYMIYVDDKPIFLVCDDTVFVKKAEPLSGLLSGAPTGVPYDGAKEHYALDAENADLLSEVARILLPVTPYPRRKIGKR